MFKIFPIPIQCELNLYVCMLAEIGNKIDCFSLNGTISPWYDLSYKSPKKKYYDTIQKSQRSDNNLITTTP